jgi:hypothetical protein
MNRDDIIRMAREAEAWPLIDHDGIAALERFAELVAVAEREACARVAEEWLGPTRDRKFHIAAAIRARGGRDDYFA